MRRSIDAFTSRTEPSQNRKFELMACQLENPPVSPTGQSPSPASFSTASYSSGPRSWEESEGGLLIGGERIGRVERIPGIAERGPRPGGPTQRRTASADLPEQNGVGRPIGDVVVSDPAVQVEDAVVVRRDRGLDVVMAAGIVGRESLRTDRDGQRSVEILTPTAVSLLGA